MAIQPNIALSVNPIQLPDLAKSYGEGVQLRNAIQQGQLVNQKLQEGDLEIAAKKKEVGAQDTLTKLLSDHTKVTPEGDLQTDHGAVYKGLADAGYGAKALSYDTQRRADLKSAIDLQEQKTKIAGQKAERLGSLAGSVPQVDWNSADAPQQAQVAQTALTRALDTAVSEGIIDQSHADQLKSQPYSPQLQAQVQQFAAAAMKAKDQHDTHISDLKEIRDQAEFGFKKNAEGRASMMAGPQLAEAQAKAAAANRAEDANTLAQAAEKNPAALFAAVSALPPERRAAFAQLNGTEKPEDIRKMGLSAEQRTTADTAAKNAENNVSEYELELRAAKGDKAAKQALASSTERKRQIAVANGTATRGLDREVAQYGKPFDEIQKSTDSQLEKVLDAEKMVAGGAVAQALAVPKVLSALVGGQGSGVRITQPELNAILKARGIGGDIEGFFKKVSGQGVLTDEQKNQLNNVLGDVRKRLIDKKMIARGVSDEMAAAPDRQAILNAAKKGRDALDAHANSASTPNAPSGVPDEVKKALSGASKNHVHTLSDGSKWLVSADGTITKQ